MHILLIRHGQTVMNAAHTIDTAAPGALLTARGHEQAASLVPRLVGQPLDALYVSILERTHQTAEPLAAARGLVPIEREGLREVEAGTWEGLNTPEAYDGYYSTLVSWFHGDTATRLGGGVTGKETLDRFDTSIREIERTGAENIAIVSHGAMIGLWAGIRAQGLSEEHLQAKHLDNTGICIIEGTLDTGYRALSWAGSPIDR